jgi:hypothetical protein
MFLSGVLFVMFLAGCWLYCLTDAALTPAWEFPGMRKRTWIALIVVTFILGAAVWAVTRYFSRPRRAVDQFLAAEAFARHPATRARQADPAYQHRYSGPEDDPEFIRQLAARIREDN